MKARQELSHRAGLHQKSQSEYNQKNGSAVLSMFYEKGMSLTAIQRTPEFLAMDGDKRSRFITSATSFMHLQDSRRLTSENRALTAQTRVARERDRAGHQAYLAWRLNPTEAAKITDEQITDFAITHGLDAANKMKDLRDDLTKPGNLNQAKMNQLQFKTIIEQYGYDGNLLESNSLSLTDKQKKDQAELRIIYDNVNDKLQATGGKLTDDQKEQIMRNAMDPKIKVDYGWAPGEIFTSDVEVPAISLPRAGERAEEFRARGATALEQIPPKSVAVYLEQIKKIRGNPGNLPNQKLITKHKKVLERAYALEAMGASVEEVKAVLSGALP